MHNPFKFLSAWDQWQKQSIQATLPIYPVPHRDHYDKYHLVCQEGHVNSRTFLFLFVLALSRVDHVISRKALGVWSEHTTLVTALKLSFVVIHLQWSNTACLTWIRGQKGALQGTCLVITFVLRCAKVSDRHSAAGGYNPTGFVCF